MKGPGGGRKNERRRELSGSGSSTPSKVDRACIRSLRSVPYRLTPNSRFAMASMARGEGPSGFSFRLMRTRPGCTPTPRMASMVGLPPEINCVAMAILSDMERATPAVPAARAPFMKPRRVQAFRAVSDGCIYDSLGNCRNDYPAEMISGTEEYSSKSYKPAIPYLQNSIVRAVRNTLTSLRTAR